MTHRSHLRPASKLVLTVGLAAGLALPAAADGAEASSLAYLTSDVVVPAPTASGVIRLRSSAVGSAALMIVGGTSIGVPLTPAFPVLRVGPPFFALPAGVVGASGSFEIPFAIDGSFPAGASIHVQGFVATPQGNFASDALRLTPVGGSPAGFSPSSGLPAAPGLVLTGDVDFCDIDKDGDLDAFVVAIEDGAAPVLMTNDGTGQFTDETAARLPRSVLLPLGQVEFGDVDGDGDEDVFLAGRLDPVSPAGNWLLLNDGTGDFDVDASFPAGAGRTIDAEFGDLDGDGDLDLVVANLEDPDHSELVDGVVVYENEAGTFTQVDAFGLVPSAEPHYGGGSVSLGDADNDGDLDLFVARSNVGPGWQNQFYVNDGTGSFTETTDESLPVGLDNSFEAMFADVNQDGLLDLVVANSVSSATGLDLLINAGGDPGDPPAFIDGTVLLPESWGGTTNVRVSLDVGDVDHDGDLDIVAGVHALPAGPFLDGEPALLLNQGGLQGGSVGSFEVDPNFALGHTFIDGDVSFADVDTDGDLDVYIANAGDLFEVLPPTDLLLVNGL